MRMVRANRSTRVALRIARSTKNPKIAQNTPKVFSALRTRVSQQAKKRFGVYQKACFQGKKKENTYTPKSLQGGCWGPLRTALVYRFWPLKRVPKPPFLAGGHGRNKVVYFLSSLRGQTAKTLICTKSGVSADSRKSAEKCRKVRRTAKDAQKMRKKYGSPHFSALLATLSGIGGNPTFCAD